MSKLDNYDFPGMPEELTNFKDDVRNIVNNGKYSNPVLVTDPDWRAANGESLFYKNGVETRWYFYADGAWQKSTFSNSVINSWCSFSGTGGGEIMDSLNVSAVTDRGVGDYDIIWDKDFSSENYAYSLFQDTFQLNVFYICCAMDTAGNPSKESIRVNVTQKALLVDAPAVRIMAIGDEG